MCNIVACFLYCSVTQPDKEGHKGFGCRGKEGDILRAPCFTVQTFGKREDKYNHITVSQMQTYFEVNGLTDGAAKLKEMRENKETHINKNGRTVRTYNMGKIRQWFMENYSVGYKKYVESKKAASNAVQMPTSNVEKEEKPAA